MNEFQIVNTANVSESEVRAVPAVPFTDTWHPYHHAKVIDHADAALERAGFGVVKKRYDVTRNGLDMFTTWQLDSGGEGSKWEIGFRNSMQKNFALGAVAGTLIMVCENLCFSGDWMDLKKHTSGLDEDRIIAMFDGAVNSMGIRLVAYEEWVVSLKTQVITEAHVKQLTFDAMKAGVFAPSNFNAFLQAYEEETAVNRELTLYNFQGACTRLMRGSALFQVQKRNAALEALLRGFVPVEEATPVIPDWKDVAHGI